MKKEKKNKKDKERQSMRTVRDDGEAYDDGERGLHLEFLDHMRDTSA